jgi:membrane protease YdiL (CAAX protease family)
LTRTASPKETTMTTINSFVKRHPLATFFTLTFGMAWGFSLFITLGGDPFTGGPAAMVLLLITLTPGLAALIVLAVSHDPEESRAFKRRLLTWRVSPTWYLAALMVGSAPWLIGAGIAAALGAQIGFRPEMVTATLPILVGSLGEELGWRNFALPQLLSLQRGGRQPDDWRRWAFGIYRPTSVSRSR